MSDELVDFLMKKAGDMVTKGDANYVEDINPDAINDDVWLKNNTSFIWKVGMVYIVDSNKADWCSLFWGQQKHHIGCSPEFLGSLHWADGEAADVGRGLQRFVRLLNYGVYVPELFKHDENIDRDNSLSIIAKMVDAELLNGATIRKALGKQNSLGAVSASDIYKLIK